MNSVFVPVEPATPEIVRFSAMGALGVVANCGAFLLFVLAVFFCFLALKNRSDHNKKIRFLVFAAICLFIWVTLYVVVGLWQPVTL